MKVRKPSTVRLGVRLSDGNIPNTFKILVLAIWLKRLRIVAVRLFEFGVFDSIPPVG